jgi:hypothetical protein
LTTLPGAPVQRLELDHRIASFELLVVGGTRDVHRDGLAIESFFAPDVRERPLVTR